MARPRKNATKAQDSLLKPDEVAEIPMEEQPYPLPEGWKWVRLGSVVSASKKKTEDFSSPSLRYIGLEHFEKDNGITGFAPAEGVRSLKNIFHSGQILYGKLRPYLNKHDIAGFDGVCSTDILVFDSLIGTNNKFINYFFNLNYFKEYVVANSKGINLPRVSEHAVLKAVFPLPPIDEQQRIVNRIESLFAKLDEAKSKAEVVLADFEIRKAALLHKAFTGELTAKWREIRGIKKENNIAKIKDILSDIKYGTSEKSDYTYTGLPVIRIPNITGSIVDLEDLKFLKSSKSSDYDLVERNDILMIRSNGSRELVGKCALVDEAIVGKAYASFLIRLRPNPTINPKYLFGFLSSSLARNQLFAKAKSSAGINNINSKEICSVDIWLPDKKEQQEIVRILDSLLAKEQQAKEAAENVLNQIDLMKKAILARAFRGELTRHIHN